MRDYRSQTTGRRLYGGKTGLLTLIFLCLCSVVSSLWSSQAYAGIAGNVRRGNRFYEAKDYEKAVEKYNQALQKTPESDIINFNAGTASYRLGDYDQARDYFQKALLSDDGGIRGKAHYNLGNTLYRLAEKVGPQNPQDAVPFLEKAVRQYEQALEIQSDDEDANFNYDFVKKVLKKVKEQIRQQQQQCQSPGRQEEGQEKQEKGGGQREHQGSSEQDEQRQGQRQQQKNAQDPSNANDQGEQRKSAGGQEEKRESGARTEENGTQESDVGDQGTEKDLSRREAEIRLRDYEQNQQPDGMLNLRGQFSQDPVLKDW